MYDASHQALTIHAHLHIRDLWSLYFFRAQGPLQRSVRNNAFNVDMLFTSFFSTYTSQKSNMKPENHPFEKEKHLPNLQFLGSLLVFGGVNVSFHGDDFQETVNTPMG